MTKTTTNQVPTAHPRLAGVVAEAPCAHCSVDVWWDEETETYEDAGEEFRCAAPSAPFGAHAA